jgi:hypothetical protein
MDASSNEQTMRRIIFASINIISIISIRNSTMTTTINDIRYIHTYSTVRLSTAAPVRGLGRRRCLLREMTFAGAKKQTPFPFAGRRRNAGTTHVTT